ncbi:MAG: hypothetical protein HPY45_01380 [Anaerolineae bacterium]|nr:hypothetical protein [Anaerolineae bacterium]
MRSYRHWTPGYLINRFVEKRYRRMHPQEPWLTPAANQFLSGYLRKGDVGLEFGSGASTLWFARRVAHLTSVEHDPNWYERVKAGLEAQGIGNVTYLYFEVPNCVPEGVLPDYPQVVDQFDPDSLDFVVVDGKLRDMCATKSLPKIRPGGILILDNADVYLPSDLKTPNARRKEQGTASPLWNDFMTAVADWRNYWTCNGVSATAIFFKPL